MFYLAKAEIRKCEMFYLLDKPKTSLDVRDLYFGKKFIFVYNDLTFGKAQEENEIIGCSEK